MNSGGDVFAAAPEAFDRPDAEQGLVKQIFLICDPARRASSICFFQRRFAARQRCNPRRHDLRDLGNRQHSCAHVFASFRVMRGSGE